MRFLIVFTLVLLACNLSDLDTKKTGLHKVSSNIKESKENEVFQYQLFPGKYAVSIGNGQFDTILESWVENQWMYANSSGKTVVQKDSALQTAIRFKNSPSVSIRDIIIKGMNSYLGWTAVANGNNSLENQTLYLVKKAFNQSEEIVLDSFILTR
ncbi:MAG TPA: hypothetical protein VFX58_12165 [Chitinophagaceae bacterium]|nr:hypothetical protein [Chitinophagaceae bacterium]